MDKETPSIIDEADPTSQQTQKQPSPPHVDPGVRLRDRRVLGPAKRRDSLGSLASKVMAAQTELASALDRIRQLDSSKDAATTAHTTSGTSPSADTTSARSHLSNSTPDDVAVAHANAIVDRHIARLKEYNDIKDTALGMLTIIADQQGRRLVEVMQERGLTEED